MKTIGKITWIGLLAVSLALSMSCGGGGSGREQPQSNWYKDADGDGFSDGTTVLASTRPAGYYLPSELTATTGDCNDADESAHPGGVEVDGDGVDQDCNGFEISGP